MADDVTYTAGANATPPDQTKATTDETSAGPHSVGSHMGIAKLAVSADGDSTHVPATVADGLLVEVSNPTAGGGLTDAELRATPVDVSVPEPLEVEGDAAHDAPVSGNPVAIGGKASLSTPTPVSADDDVSFIRTDLFGNIGARITDSNGNLIGLGTSNDGGLPVEVNSAGVFPVQAQIRDNAGNIVNVGEGAFGSPMPVSVPEPLEVEGDAAHDAPVSGNPVAIGGRANSGPPAQVADDDAVWIRTDLYGNVAVRLSDTNGSIYQFDPTVDGGLPVEPVGGGQFQSRIWVNDAAGNAQQVGTGAGGVPVPISDDGGSITVDGTVTADTELPAAAALTDSFANPTAPAVGAFGMYWDAANSVWKRVAMAQGNDAAVESLAISPVGFSGQPLLGGYAVDQDPFSNNLTVSLQALNGALYDRLRGDATNGLDVDVTRLPSSGTATRTQVADTASDALLLAANAAREKYAITNDSTAILYLADGTTAASTTNYTVQIQPGGYFENTNFTGEVRGIWATDPGTGAARITEYT